MLSSNQNTKTASVRWFYHSHKDIGLFSSMQNDGVECVVLKVTEGWDYVDPEFKSFIAQAKNNEFQIGAFHFGTNLSPGAAQANQFLKALLGELETSSSKTQELLKEESDLWKQLFAQQKNAGSPNSEKIKQIEISLSDIAEKLQKKECKEEFQAALKNVVMSISFMKHIKRTKKVLCM